MTRPPARLRKKTVPLRFKIIYLTSEQYQKQSIGLKKLIKVSECWAAIIFLSYRLATQSASLRTKSRFTADVHGDAVPGTSTESSRWSDWIPVFIFSILDIVAYFGAANLDNFLIIASKTFLDHNFLIVY